MRLLALTKYPERGPSSRYRLLQFLPYFKAAGFEVTVQSLHTNDYLDHLFDQRALPPGYFTARLRERLAILRRAGDFDIVFVQKELLPYVPAWVEHGLLRVRTPIVLDIDDAIHLTYGSARSFWVRLLLRRKTFKVARRTQMVLAGNAYLADVTREAGAARVEYLPTVVDTQRFVPRDRDPSEVTVGWIGSPATSRYLELLRPVASELGGAVNWLFVGANIDDWPAPNASRPWSHDSEVELLQRFDIGVMPLVDDKWSQGKCALKLLQYMSCGVAAVTTPVGASLVVADGGRCARLATDANSWANVIRELATDVACRRALAAAGRERVVSDYALDRWGPHLASLLAEVVRD